MTNPVLCKKDHVSTALARKELAPLIEDANQDGVASRQVLADALIERGLIKGDDPVKETDRWIIEKAIADHLEIDCCICALLRDYPRGASSSSVIFDDPMYTIGPPLKMEEQAQVIATLQEFKRGFRAPLSARVHLKRWKR